MLVSGPTPTARTTIRANSTVAPTTKYSFGTFVFSYCSKKEEETVQTGTLDNLVAAEVASRIIEPRRLYAGTSECRDPRSAVCSHCSRLPQPSEAEQCRPIWIEERPVSVARNPC
jgi:hypothetical protein